VNPNQTFRIILIAAISMILIGALFVGFVNALGPQAVGEAKAKASLDNVRAYAPALSTNTANYAVDGGDLFHGTPGSWAQMDTPRNVIVNAVAIDPQRTDTIYIGAANELTVYRSENSGRNWLRIPLTDGLTGDQVGGVTDIAIDGVQRLLYVGTDNAGLFRLRDVGSGVNLTGQLQLDEPVVEVAADSSGAGLAFVRTESKLYRAEDSGLRWVEVENLLSAPTSVAVADTTPVTIYVGTTDRGLLRSNDGLTWALANDGLGLNPGTRLSIDALALDSAQPEVLYVASSYLFGSTTVHRAPTGISMSTDSAASWSLLSEPKDVAVAELIPMAGETGSAFALMANSRTPVALGGAAATVAANTVAANTQAVAEAQQRTAPTPIDSSLAAWLIAGLAALALLFAAGSDIGRRMRSLRKNVHPGLSARLIEHRR
jgi:hypothetical protein